MKKNQLDTIDRNILWNLQAKGRMSNVNLAKEVGISAPPCLRRVRVLEEKGYIKGYHAQIDHAKMGYGVTVFAMVRLKSQAEDDLAAFENHVAALPAVRECFMLAGEIDFILKIVARDWDAYQEIFAQDLSRAPHVMSIKSCLSIKTTKNMPGVPVQI